MNYKKIKFNDETFLVIKIDSDRVIFWSSVSNDFLFSISNKLFTTMISCLVHAAKHNEDVYVVYAEDGSFLLEGIETKHICDIEKVFIRYIKKGKDESGFKMYYVYDIEIAPKTHSIIGEGV